MEDRKRITNAELTRAYQKVFGSGKDGTMVLADILSLLGYFGNQSQRMNPDLLAAANTILVRLNVFDSTNVERFAEMIIDGALPPKEDNDNDF